MDDAVGGGTGIALTVNAKARFAMSAEAESRPWHDEERLWSSLGWPSVPFCHWPWHGARISAWDCPLEVTADGVELLIRYLSHERVPDALPLQRMAVLGQEVMRVAHDLRQPLTSVEWFATLLDKDGLAADERTEYAGHLRQACQSLDGILENVLLFAKPLRPDREAIAMAALLDDVEWLAAPALRQKRITVRCSLDAGLHTIRGENLLVKRAILNLVMNAIQVSVPGGHIEMVCRRIPLASATEEAGRATTGVRVSVRDWGCGIAAEDIPNIFDPFYSTRKGGTGLGLPIVEHIVNAHGGFIDVVSELGTGTTVSLVFPE